MHTNQIPYWDTAMQINERLAGAPAGILVFLLCIAAGYVWKMIHVLPNRFVPLVVMLGGAVLNPLLYWPVTAKDAVRLTVVGFIIGFISWLVHKLVLNKLETKLGVKLEENGNTEIWTRPPAHNPPKDEEPPKE